MPLYRRSIFPFETQISAYILMMSRRQGIFALVYPIRLLLRIGRLAALLTGVFVLAFGFIRMRPNNNADILALLSPPEGCPAKAMSPA